MGGTYREGRGGVMEEGVVGITASPEYDIVNAGDTLFSILKFSMKMSQYPNDSQVSSGPWPRLDSSLINDELEALSSVDRTCSDHEYTG